MDVNGRHKGEEPVALEPLWACSTPAKSETSDGGRRLLSHLGGGKQDALPRERCKGPSFSTRFSTVFFQAFPQPRDWQAKAGLPARLGPLLGSTPSPPALPSRAIFPAFHCQNLLLPHLIPSVAAPCQVIDASSVKSVASLHSGHWFSTSCPRPAASPGNL